LIYCYSLPPRGFARIEGSPPLYPYNRLFPIVVATTGIVFGCGGGI